MTTLRRGIWPNRQEKRAIERRLRRLLDTAPRDKTLTIKGEWVTALGLPRMNEILAEYGIGPIERKKREDIRYADDE